MKRKTSKCPDFYFWEFFDLYLHGGINYLTLTTLIDECVHIQQEVVKSSNNYRRNHNLPPLRYCKYKVKRFKGKSWFDSEEMRRLMHQKIGKMNNSC